MYAIGIVALLSIIFLLGIVLQHRLISNSNSSARKLISAPSFRRRHRNFIPLTGGVGIILTFFAALLALTPYYGLDFLVRFSPIGLAMAMIFAVGLADDLYNMSPKLKLIGELVSASVVLLSPDIQNFAVGWQESIGFAIWPLIIFWIVGVTNAINLIDGLDGLAASYVLLALSAIAVSCAVFGHGTSFQLPIVVAMMVSVVPFSMFNRPPAKVFLGDNGSLTLGLFLSTFCLLKPGSSSGWNETMSIILIAGYPILDMGWVTWIRIRKGFSPFTADRSHIHYRLLKFKLHVTEVVGLLMCVNLVFLVSSFLLTQVTPLLSLLVLGSAVTCVFILLKLVHNFDRWKNAILSESPQRPAVVEDLPETTKAVMLVDVKPIFQALETTDQKLIEGVLDSLSGHLHINYRRNEGFILLRSRSEFRLATPQDPEVFYDELSSSLRSWLKFNDIPISLPNLPIAIVESSQWQKNTEVKKAA